VRTGWEGSAELVEHPLGVRMGQPFTFPLADEVSYRLIFTNMLLTTSSKNLLKAATIVQEIESLEARLQELLGEAGPAQSVEPVEKASGRTKKSETGKQPARNKQKAKTSANGATNGNGSRESAPPTVSESKTAKTAPKSKESGASKKKSNGSEPAGTGVGLTQAIREVLSASGKPLNVSGIYDALIARNYAFSFSEPKKGLSMRMYRISGVKPLGQGMFAATKD
jgi:hypothetical protein